MFADDRDTEIRGLPPRLSHNLIDRLLAGCFFISVVGLPASLSRVSDTGWLALHTAHSMLAVVAISVFLARKQLQYRGKFFFVVALFYGVGIAGSITLGLLGAGLWWLVVSSLLLGVLHSPRVGLWATCGSFLFFGLVGYGFVSGTLKLQVDANAYVTNVSSWITLVVGTSVMPFFVFQAIATLNEESARLLRTVESQRDEIARMARHDQLTGLLMPRALADRLNHALLTSKRSGTGLALMFLDLDRFKAVNDTFGHAAGDHLLKVLAQRFSNILRETDSKARIGGDEFIFLLEQPGAPADVAVIAQRLVVAAAEPVTFGDLELEVGVSIGISLYPDHGSDAVTLRRAADMAMYRVKAAGRNDYRFADGPELALEPPRHENSPAGNVDESQLPGSRDAVAR